MIFLQLFITFFQIGLFGFGGGYGMLSLIQTETVVRHQWLTSAEFTNIVAISQMTPGPIGINSAADTLPYTTQASARAWLCWEAPPRRSHSYCRR